MIHTFPNLARHAVEHHVHSKDASLQLGAELTPFLKQRAGAFVTLKMAQRLRGCIGTISPVYQHLIAEICTNAVAAATQDPRFPPVQASELSQLDYSVSVMHEPEPVAHKNELDPQRYGVVVTSGRRQGLLLPHLEGIDTVEEQLYHVRRKAGILPHESVTLERFQVDLYSEKKG